MEPVPTSKSEWGIELGYYSNLLVVARKEMGAILSL